MTNRNMKVALPLVTVPENIRFLVFLFVTRIAVFFLSLLCPLIPSDVWVIPSLYGPCYVLRARFADAQRYVDCCRA